MSAKRSKFFGGEPNSLNLAYQFCEQELAEAVVKLDRSELMELNEKLTRWSTQLSVLIEMKSQTDSFHAPRALLN